MQTQIPATLLESETGRRADRILRSCVHCGFCAAVCPTYQLLGDELDGPRGRIYLIKQALEGRKVSRRTQLHLDRCLSCRACESSCPSSVEYGRLLDIGRARVDALVTRRLRERVERWLLARVFPIEGRVRLLMFLARAFSTLLPASLRRQIPPRQSLKTVPADAPAPTARRILLLRGCVQAAATPQTNLSAARVLGKLGIGATEAAGAGCCGAISHHLGYGQAAAHFMKRNVDTWWPLLEAGAEAIVATASGCGAMIKEYGELLQADRDYADKARRVSQATRDLSEVVAAEDLGTLDNAPKATRVAVHLPCTLQHALKADRHIKNILMAAGYTISNADDDQHCCGSAGTYSLLQPDLSQQLLARKIDTLMSGAPDVVVTANIGCPLHIGSRCPRPVRHWIQLIEDALEH